MDTRRTRPPLRAPLRLLGAAAAVATLLAVILTGCGGGGDAPSSSPAAPAAGTGAASDEFGASGQDTEQMAGPAQDSAAGSGAAQDSGQKSGGTSSKAASPGSSGSAGLLADPSAITKRVRTADLIVRVKDLSAAAAQIRAAATRLGGSVASENSQSAAAGVLAQDVLVVRVPEPKLEDAISAVSATGTELARKSESSDVTAVLADLESRENSQRASVERVRALMAKATSLQDIVLLESELSRREADLEAAEASRRSMADQAAQATLSITLTTTNHPVTPDDDQDNGFLAGLHKSWHALQVSTGVLLTIAGALLPVAIALLIIGWPAFLLLRRYFAGRRLATRTTPAPASPPAAPPATP